MNGLQADGEQLRSFKCRYDEIKDTKEISYRFHFIYFDSCVVRSCLLAVASVETLFFFLGF